MVNRKCELTFNFYGMQVTVTGEYTPEELADDQGPAVPSHFEVDEVTVGADKVSIRELLECLVFPEFRTPALTELGWTACGVYENGL